MSECRDCGVLLIGSDVGWCDKCRRKRSGYSQRRERTPANGIYCYICGAKPDCHCDVPMTAEEYERAKAEARAWHASQQRRGVNNASIWMTYRHPRIYRKPTIG